MMTKFRSSLAILALSLPLLAANADQDFSAFEQTLLELSPKVCVKPKEQNNCSIEVTITVNNKEQNGFCLVSSDLAINICIEQISETYTHSVDVDTQNSIEIDLTSLDGSEIYETQKFVVAEFTPSQTRRRRNLGWIF